jgi:hypothetical protein
MCRHACKGNKEDMVGMQYAMHEDGVQKHVGTAAGGSTNRRIGTSPPHTRCPSLHGEITVGAYIEDRSVSNECHIFLDRTAPRTRWGPTYLERGVGWGWGCKDLCLIGGQHI